MEYIPLSALNDREEIAALAKAEIRSKYLRGQTEHRTDLPTGGLSWFASAAREEAELAIVESYMPAAPTEAEVDAAIAAAITETGVTDKAKMGLVMNAAKTRLAGKRLDGKVLSDKVRAALG